MPYDKKKTFDAAERRATLSAMKEKQNVKPNQENFYSAGWISGRYNTHDEAKKAYDAAMAKYHEKDKDRKKTPSEQAKELLRIRKENRKKKESRRENK